MSSALPPQPVDGDVRHGTTLNGLIWLFTSITTIVFASRIYARKFLTRNLGWDDALLGFSMALLYIQCAFVSVSVSYGLGRHEYYLLVENPVDVSNVVKWQLFSEPVAIFGGSVPKIAVTILIIKLLNPSRFAVAYLWTLNIILNAWSIVCVAVSFAQCTPTKTYWTRTGGKCWDAQIVTNIALAQGALSCFADFNLALFPTTIIISLQMKAAKKVAVCLLMGLGCFAGVASIIRTTKLAKLNAQSDLTYEAWTLVLWVAIECCVIITCACIPSLRPLFRKWFGESFGSTFPSFPSFALRSKKSSIQSQSAKAPFKLDSRAPSSVPSSINSGKERIVKIFASDDQSEKGSNDLEFLTGEGIFARTDVEVRSSLKAV